jgi:hypothetical protein
MHLVYFLFGGPPAIKTADLGQWGLGHVATTHGVQCQQIASGPEGNAGLLVSAGNVPPAHLRYVPDDQEWTVAPAKFCPAGKRWAVGYMVASGTPGPDQLARKHQLDSRSVQMADLREWKIPLAKQWFRVENQDPPAAWSHSLPRVMQLDDEGKFAPGQVHAKYRRLWDMAVEYETKLFDAVSQYADDQDSVTFDFDSTVMAVEALSLNYHMGAVEISLLGLLDTDVIQTVADTIRDAGTLNLIMAEIQEAKAKNAPRQETTQGSGPGLIPAEHASEAATTTTTQ